jgi:hypothetical protein
MELFVVGAASKMLLLQQVPHGYYCFGLLTLPSQANIPSITSSSIIYNLTIIILQNSCSNTLLDSSQPINAFFGSDIACLAL